MKIENEISIKVFFAPNKGKEESERKRVRECEENSLRLCKLGARNVKESIKFHKMWAWRTEQGQVVDDDFWPCVEAC